MRQEARTQSVDMAEGLPGSGMASIKFQTVCTGVISITEFSKTFCRHVHMFSETDFCLVESKQ